MAYGRAAEVDDCAQAAAIDEEIRSHHVAVYPGFAGPLAAQPSESLLAGHVARQNGWPAGSSITRSAAGSRSGG